MSFFIFIFLFSLFSFGSESSLDENFSKNPFKSFSISFSQKDKKTLKKLITESFDLLDGYQKNIVLGALNDLGDVDLIKKIDTQYLKTNNSILHQSITSPDALRYYLEDLKIDANTLNNQKESALMFASSSHVEESEKSLESIRILLKNGADIHLENEYGKKAFHQAVHSNKIKTTDLLLENGASIHDRFSNVPILYIPIKKVYPSMLEFLIKKGADPKELYAGGLSLVHAALSSKEDHKVISILDVLLEYIDINAYLSETGFLTISDQLTGQQKQVKFPYTLLTKVAKDGRASLLTYLIEKGVDLNKADRSGKEAIHVAASNNNKTFLKVLLENKVDVNSLDKKGKTALFEAAYANASRSLGFLLENGADPEIPFKTESSSSTPLVRAVQSNSSTSVRILIEHGADMNKKIIETRASEKGSHSLLYYALNKSSKKGFIKTALVLLSKNAKLTQKEESLIKEQNPILLDLLEKYQLDPEASDPQEDVRYKKALIEEHLRRVNHLDQKLEDRILMRQSSDAYDLVNFEDKDIEKKVLESFSHSDEFSYEKPVNPEVYESFSKKPNTREARRQPEKLEEKKVEVSYTNRSDREKEANRKKLEGVTSFMEKIRKQDMREKRVGSFKNSAFGRIVRAGRK